MLELIARQSALSVCKKCGWVDDEDFIDGYNTAIKDIREAINELPTVESKPVQHGRWIECDYKHMEHGMIETEPKAGLCCSECCTAFQKKKMEYKQYCAACGSMNLEA